SVAPGGRAWMVLAGAARAGVVLDAAARVLGHSIQELDAMAQDAPLVDAAAFLAGLQGAAGPVAPGEAPGAVWRGLLRALSERTAETASRVAELVPAERLLVIGGGAASRPWLREKADVVSLPLVRPRTTPAAARGAAVFAGQAAGWWASPEEAPRP
ncbi:MAG TPA: FGGY-family carbohydrate kinase, partial [Actinomycetota bacterium]|nr:FGGY-family carbohydrate kinase [Actinomycetota bacterium]